MRRSASRLMNSIISTGPPGKAFAASAGLSPRSRAPAIIATPVQPSKGTCASVASSNLRRVSSIGIVRLLRGARPAALHLFDENEARQVGHSLRIEDAVEMVAFMLHHPGME